MKEENHVNDQDEAELSPLKVDNGALQEPKLSSCESDFKKSETIVPTQERPQLALTLAIIAGLCHAVGNAINTEITRILGMKAITLQAYGALLSFTIYHIVMIILRRCNDSKRLPSDNYMVLDGETRAKRFSCRRISLPFLYLMITIASLSAIFGTFHFLGMCEKPVNSGIITSLFASSLLLTSLAFYCLYG